MADPNQFYSEGIRLTLYKSVIPELKKPAQWDFFLWGASNFLLVDKFSSLTQFARPITDQSNTNDLGANHKSENRFLYLYKDNESNLVPGKEVDWIFRVGLEYPLLVITLLKAELSQVIPKVKDIANTLPLSYDFFKTLGHGSCVLIIRCKTYSHAINCLVELNKLSENTYSIAGLENPFLQQKPARKKGSFLFPNLEQTDVEGRGPSQADVSINYMLQEVKTGNRLQAVIARISQLKTKMFSDFDLQEADLKISTYYEIGRFDIEVRIQGQIVHVLELLLNPEYGLAHIESKFYREYIFESRTTWKTPSL